jgi:hypothetical protein
MIGGANGGSAGGADAVALKSAGAANGKAMAQQMADHRAAQERHEHEGHRQSTARAVVLPDGTKQFELTTKIVDWEVEPGKTVKAWTYNGQVPGPMIKVADGDKVQIVVKNELPQSTSVHFHGLEVPNAMDGVPYITQDPITPGETFTYSFVANAGDRVTLLALGQPMNAVADVFSPTGSRIGGSWYALRGGVAYVRCQRTRRASGSADHRSRLWPVTSSRHLAKPSRSTT